MVRAGGFLPLLLQRLVLLVVNVKHYSSNLHKHVHAHARTCVCEELTQFVLWNAKTFLDPKITEECVCVRERGRYGPDGSDEFSG